MRNVVVGVGTVLLGAFLLSLAVPRLVANLTLLPGNPAIGLIMDGQSLSRQGYDRILSSRRAALPWLDDSDTRLQLGGTLYLMAEEADQLGVDQHATLVEAREQLEKSLSEAPANMFGWFWLADIELHLGDPERAVRALRVSLRAAPHSFDVAPLRGGLALALWDKLDLDMREMGAVDVRRTLGTEVGGSFVRLMRQTDRGPALRQAMMDDKVAFATLWLLGRHDESAE